jgi:hypothetical protein
MPLSCTEGTVEKIFAYTVYRDILKTWRHLHATLGFVRLQLASTLLSRLVGDQISSFMVLKSFLAFVNFWWKLSLLSV